MSIIETAAAVFIGLVLHSWAHRALYRWALKRAHYMPLAQRLADWVTR